MFICRGGAERVTRHFLEADYISLGCKRCKLNTISLFCSNQELQDLLRQYSQAVPVQRAWLESCFSKQTRVNTAQYLHKLR